MDEKLYAYLENLTKGVRTLDDRSKDVQENIEILQDDVEEIRVDLDKVKELVKPEDVSKAKIDAERVFSTLNHSELKEELIGYFIDMRINKLNPQEYYRNYHFIIEALFKRLKSFVPKDALKSEVNHNGQKVPAYEVVFDIDRVRTSKNKTDEQKESQIKILLNLREKSRNETLDYSRCNHMDKFKIYSIYFSGAVRIDNFYIIRNIKIVRDILSHPSELEESKIKKLEKTIGYLNQPKANDLLIKIIGDFIPFLNK